MEGGHEVHAVGLPSADDVSLNCAFHRADLINGNGIGDVIHQIKPSHLLHLSWCTQPGKYWTSPENLAWVRASLSLFEQFVEAGGSRVVAAGSCAEYDWQYGFCSELLTPLRPDTLYGQCKNSLNSILQTYARQSGISAGWGRLFFPYGPNERPERLVPSVIGSILRGETARCTAGTQIRDFIFVEDAARAFVALLESDFSGAVNIGSGQPISVKDMATRLAEKLGRPDLVQFGAIENRTAEPPLLVADTRLLLAETSYSPRESLDSGLDKTIAWWRECILSRISP